MRKFRLQGPPRPPRRFRLPNERAAMPFAPIVPDPAPAKPPTRSPVVRWEGREPPGSGSAQTPARSRTRPARRQRAQLGGGAVVKAPIGTRKGRREISFTAATEADLPGMFGTLRLRCTPDAVDLSRLSDGILSLCVDHNTSELCGRIVEARVQDGRVDMKAEMGTTPRAVNTLAEVDGLLRTGFSPGFLINASEPIPDNDPAYDEDYFLQLEITKWTIFECSSTAIPRNQKALLKGVASMATTQPMTGTEAPDIVHWDDPIGLNLAVARTAVRTGKGSVKQTPSAGGFPPHLRRRARERERP